MNLIPRLAAERVERALADTPVVVVHGPRQAGKSTLVRDLLAARGARYVTFDAIAPREAASQDPEGFLGGLDGPVVLDEVQRVPGLVLATKAQVDLDRRPGRFLLTGSADIFARARADDSLAGRRETVRLWPFAQAERAGLDDWDVGRLFADPDLGRAPPVSADELLDRLTRGGYPEATVRGPERRAAWFDAYLDEVTRFEVAALSAIEGLAQIPTLLRLLAARQAGLLNASNLARDLGVSPTTAQRYLTLLVETFLVHLVPAWTASVRKRQVKSPKVVIVDSGLAAHLLGPPSPPPQAVGMLVEGFVLSELRRLVDASPTGFRLHHFRTHAQREVDAVVEAPDGRVVGIEVKAARTVRSQDFSGLRDLADAVGERFAGGLLLHAGTEAVPFGPRLWSAPVSVLWSQV